LLVRRACAKINLTLDVFSKRADGYHSIASVMQAIGLYDILTFRATTEPGIRFTCDAPDAPDVPMDATNLVVRAAQVTLDAANEMGKTISNNTLSNNTLVGGVEIHLEKRIPSQAGLGGGSSDAAATLRGVNDLLGLGLPAETLRALAAQLGSDIPFFLIGGTAVARGRGELLSALPDVPPLWLTVVKPEESVSTGWAYNELDALPDRQSHRGTKRLEEALRQEDMGRLIAFQSNDFELPVFTHHPKLAWLHDELRMAGAVTAHLCGSGSALYGVAESEQAAERTARLLRQLYPRVSVARTLTRAESLDTGDPA
jgi:4-diphosphocytidyl-2-C-methyl-D-erythritol kinase